MTRGEFDRMTKADWEKYPLCTCNVPFLPLDFGRLAKCTGCKEETYMLAVEAQKRAKA